MRNVYIMDKPMPVPNRREKLPTYLDLRQFPEKYFNEELSNAFRKWVKEEFNKIIGAKGVTISYDFSEFIFEFFDPSEWGTPPASFFLDKGIVAIGQKSNNFEGTIADSQSSALHEAAHASTARVYKVGVSISEGIAVFLEKLFAEFYEIQIYTLDHINRVYKFSLNMIENVIKNVYHDNLDLFFQRVLKGNEESFINDIDNYLTNNNSKYSAKELLRLTSILFYAIREKNSPSEKLEYNEIDHKAQRYRDEILMCFSNQVIDEGLEINNLLESIKRIEMVLDLFLTRIEEKSTFTATLDREMAKLLLTDLQAFSDINNRPDVLLQILKSIVDIYNQSNNKDYEIISNTEFIEQIKEALRNGKLCKAGKPSSSLETVIADVKPPAADKADSVISTATKSLGEGVISTDD